MASFRVPLFDALCNCIGTLRKSVSLLSSKNPLPPRSSTMNLRKERSGILASVHYLRMKSQVKNASVNKIGSMALSDRGDQKQRSVGSPGSLIIESFQLPPSKWELLEEPEKHDAESQFFAEYQKLFLFVSHLKTSALVGCVSWWHKKWFSWVVKDFQQFQSFLLKEGYISVEDSGQSPRERIRFLLTLVDKDGMVDTLNELEEDMVLKLNRKRHSTGKYLDFGYADLDGMTNEQLDYFGNSELKRAQGDFHSQTYRVPCNMNAMDNVIGYCKRRDIREKIFSGFMSHFQEDLTISRFNDILQLRHEIANELGFESWSQLETVQLGIKNDDEMTKCFEMLFNKLKPEAVKVLEKGIAGGAKSDKATDYKKFDLIDEDYILARARNTHLLEPLRDYFEADGTIERVLRKMEDIFPVEVETVPRGLDSFITSGWTSDILTFKISRKSEQPGRKWGDAQSGGEQRTLGFVYVAIHPPRFTASSSPFSGAVLLSPGHAFINLNFSRCSVMEKRTLIASEVITTCHEVGHAIHLLLAPDAAHIRYPGWPVDLIEFPSTLVESLCLKPEIFKELGRHKKTGEKVPSHLLPPTQRDAYWFIKTLRDASLYHFLHSKHYNSFKANMRDLRYAADENYQKMCVLKLGPRFQFMSSWGIFWGALAPRGHTTWLAYQLAYIRAYSVISKAKEDGLDVGALVKAEFLEKDLEPSAAKAVISARSDSPQRVGFLQPPLSVGARAGVEEAGVLLRAASVDRFVKELQGNEAPQKGKLRVG